VALTKPIASCAICGRWPFALRSVMRAAINVLLLKEPICAECMKAFWADITIKTRAKGQRAT
jgi:hypothetical protein